MTLAEIALTEPLRSQLLSRNRGLIKSGYTRIESGLPRAAGCYRLCRRPPLP